eukprot:4809839-Prymnesium_polylepis.1
MSTCASRWWTPTNGLPCASASALAPSQPTRRPAARRTAHGARRLWRTTRETTFRKGSSGCAASDVGANASSRGCSSRERAYKSRGRVRR